MSNIKLVWHNGALVYGKRLTVMSLYGVINTCMFWCIAKVILSASVSLSFFNFWHGIQSRIWEWTLISQKILSKFDSLPNGDWTWHLIFELTKKPGNVPFFSHGREYSETYLSWTIWLHFVFSWQHDLDTVPISANALLWGFLCTL